MSAVYTIFTSPDHPPVPDHLPTLIVTPHGKPQQILYTYLHTNYNRENYLLTPSPQGDLCVAKLFPPPTTVGGGASSRLNGGKSASEGGHASSSSQSNSQGARTVKCEASRNFRWSITNSGVLTPTYKCTLPSDDAAGIGEEQPLFQISKTNPQSPFWTCAYYAYAGHLIPPRRIQFGHIAKNIGPDGKPITGGGTRVTITGKTDEEKAVWKTLGEGNEDMVEWAVICAALHVLDDEIVKAAEKAGIRIGVMPGAAKGPSNRATPPAASLPKLQLHPTGHRPGTVPPPLQSPPIIPNSRPPNAMPFPPQPIPQNQDQQRMQSQQPPSQQQMQQQQMQRSHGQHPMSQMPPHPSQQQQAAMPPSRSPNMQSQQRPIDPFASSRSLPQPGPSQPYPNSQQPNQQPSRAGSLPAGLSQYAGQSRPHPQAMPGGSAPQQLMGLPSNPAGQMPYPTPGSRGPLPQAQHGGPIPMQNGHHGPPNGERPRLLSNNASRPQFALSPDQMSPPMVPGSSAPPPSRPLPNLQYHMQAGPPGRGPPQQQHGPGQVPQQMAQGSGLPPRPGPNDQQSYYPNGQRQQTLPPPRINLQNGSNVAPPLQSAPMGSLNALRSRSPLPQPGGNGQQFANDGRMAFPVPPRTHSSSPQGFDPSQRRPSAPASSSYGMPHPDSQAGQPGYPRQEPVTPRHVRTIPPSQSAPPKSSRSPPPRELLEEDTVDSVAFMLGATALNDAAAHEGASSMMDATGGIGNNNVRPPGSRVARLLKTR